MTSLRALALASTAVVVGAQPLFAQGLSHYRTYALESSVASVIAISGGREADTRTSYERPARIQELEWRAPYSRPGTGKADPVHDVQFSFYDDQLYQVVVSYDRDRMEGLTSADVVESLSATYGVPLLAGTRTPGSTERTDAPSDVTVLARWEDAASLLTLTRGTFAPQFQLVLISKSLNGRALAAIKESRRLDRQEAPQRAQDLRQKEVADAMAAGQKARVVNKPAFRP
jgi:hypothetical protein